MEGSAVTDLERLLVAAEALCEEHERGQSGVNERVRLRSLLKAQSALAERDALKAKLKDLIEAASAVESVLSTGQRVLVRELEQLRAALSRAKGE
jgi:hypothetical protein